jgi:hypothetical protein
MAGARQMLVDRGALASTLKACGLAAAELKQALEVVDCKVKSVDEIGAMDAARSVVERVELKRDGMQITLNLRALFPTELVSDGGGSLCMTRVVRMQMKRRGVETRLVIPGEAVAVSRSDPALLRALSRGYQWFRELALGRVASTKQIAAREGLSHSYVRHVVPTRTTRPQAHRSDLCGTTIRYHFGGAFEGPRSSPHRMGCAAALSFGLNANPSDLTGQRPLRLEKRPPRTADLETIVRATASRLS